MAYVPGFDYDLFVSYASDDFDDELRQFFDRLRVYLRRELGKDFPQDRGIYLDREELNRAPAQWKQRLRESVGSAAILIPVLSPSWASSEYCAKEWEWFQEHHPLNWSAGPETVFRVGPVHWRDLDPDMLLQIPEALRSAQQLRIPDAEKFGATIANGLRLMRRSRQTVYVGEAEHEVRQKVCDEMTRIGFRVRPEAPTAYGDRQIVRQLLGEASLAVHFVGSQENQRLIDTIGLSREYCRAATIVYEIPGVDLEPAERLMLEWLEHDLSQAPAADSRSYDRISGRNKNLDQFLQVIRDRLEGAGPSAPTRIGIACEEADRPAVESVIPEIQRETGFSVTCHGMSLLEYKKSRGILFYWGNADGARLRQARVVVKALFAYYFAPPPNPRKSETELPGCDILRQRGDRFVIDDIRPFLERLGWKP